MDAQARPTGIAIFNNRLYFYDSTQEQIIQSRNRNSLRNGRVLRSNIKGVRALKVYYDRHSGGSTDILAVEVDTCRVIGYGRNRNSLCNNWVQSLFDRHFGSLPTYGLQQLNKPKDGGK